MLGLNHDLKKNPEHKSEAMKLASKAYRFAYLLKGSEVADIYTDEINNAIEYAEVLELMFPDEEESRPRPVMLWEDPFGRTEQRWRWTKHVRTT